MDDITKKLPCGATVKAYVPIGTYLHVDVYDAYAGLYLFEQGKFKLIIGLNSLPILKEIIDGFIAKQAPVQQPPKKSFWTRLWNRIEHLGCGVIGCVGDIRNVRE